MDSYPLFKEDFLLAVPSLHPLNEKAVYVPGRRYRMIRPEDLTGQDLILQTSWQSSRVIEDRILKDHQVSPGRIREIRSFETAIRMVSEGLGISFIRENYAIFMRTSKPVNYYSLYTASYQKEVVVAHKSGIRVPEYMQDMIRMLQKYCEDFPDLNENKIRS